jgi:predicted amidohydrolase YtcJ
MNDLKMFDLVRIRKPTKAERKQGVMWSVYYGLAAVHSMPDKNGYVQVYAEARRNEGKGGFCLVPAVQVKKLTPNQVRALLKKRADKGLVKNETIKFMVAQAILGSEATISSGQMARLLLSFLLI